jgi:hypothetical protein
MAKRLLRRPSPAMVVAVLALCVALGGTSFAAVKLGKNAVKTKNIKNNAVTSGKIANGAVTEGKIAANAVTEGKIANGAVTGGKIANGAIGSGQLAGTAKSLWVQMDIGGTDIVGQSGGITVTPNGTGVKVVNFGTNVANRGIVITTVLTLGETTAEFGRCTDIGCPGAAADNPNAIEVFTFDASTNNLVNTGFSAVAVP